MIAELEPIVGQWYYHLDKGQNFTVVAIDDDSGYIEIQHFDGDIEEMLYDEWYDLDIELSEDPENWIGQIDIGELDDLGTNITETPLSEWNQSLQELRNPEQEKLSQQDEESGQALGEVELNELG